MPLARIISPSTTGCRELAMDLLARGYSVEIVEPDKVPDNFADLELRVEPPIAKPAAANPVAYGSGPSAPPDLVQYFREPMPNFVRRPPNRDDLIAAGIITRPEPAPVAEVKPQPKVVADLQLKAVGEIRSVAPIASPQTTPVPAPSRSNPEKIAVQIKAPAAASKSTLKVEGTPSLQLLRKPEVPVLAAPERLIEDAGPTERISSPVKETSKRTGITITIHRSRWKDSAGRTWLNAALLNANWFNAFMRSNGAFLRASAGFAATVALGGVLLVSVRGSGPLAQTAAVTSQNSEAKITVAPRSEAKSTIAAAPRSSTTTSQTAGKAATQSSVVPNTALANGKTQSKNVLAKDLKPEPPVVQRDRPSAKSASAGRKQPRHHHGDSMIAKDTVTYLKK